MEAFHCPKCGADNYPGLMGFPRCHRCHEQLRQCRYCTRQVGGLCRVPEAARPRLEQEDGRPFCTAFDSRLRNELPQGLRRPMSSGARAAGLLAVVLVALVAIVAMAARREVLVPQVEADDPAVDVQDGRAVAGFTVTVADGSAREGTPVVVQVDPGILNRYVLEEPDLPGHGSSSRSRLEYPYLVLPGVPLRLTFTLMPCSDLPRHGSVPLRINLLTRNGVVTSQAETLIRW